MTTLREAARAGYSAESAPTHEEIRTGCLQRIADATELMAKHHQELVDERDRFKRYYESQQGINAMLGRRIIALRGRITRLQRQLAKAGEGAS